jgi:O-antigen/teichoic acid export membrane protein
MKTSHAVVANYFSVGWTAVLSIAFVPLYIHILGIEAYALVGLYTVIQAWLGLLDLGLTPTLVREAARFSSGQLSEREIGTLVRSFEAVFAGIGTSITLGLAALAGLITHYWLRAPSLPPGAINLSIALMGLIIAGRFFEGLYRSALIGLNDQVWMSMASAINATLRSVGALGVLWFVSPTIEAFFVWNAAVGVFAALLYRTRVRRWLKGGLHGARPSLSALARVRAFAGGMSGILVLSLMLNQLDKVLLSRLLPLADFGYYMFASTAASAILVIVGPVNQAFYPRFVAVHENPQALSHLTRLAMQTILLVLVPIAAVLCVMPHQIIMIWSGNPALAAQSAPLLAGLALGNALNGMTQIPFNVNLASGRTRSNIVVFATGVVLAVPALMLLVPRGGGLAAAWIWCTLNALLIVLIMALTPRALLPGATVRGMLRDFFVTAGATAAVVAAIRTQLPAEGWSRSAQLAYLAGTSILAGLTTILCLPQIRTRAAALLDRAFQRIGRRATPGAGNV